MGLRHLREDFIHGTRLVGRAPRLSAFVVAVLGLAQAATVTVFGVVNATLLRPLPGREPEQVVLLDCTYRGSPSAFSPPTFADLRAGTRVFASLSAAVPWDVNLVGGGDPERVHGQLVSADLFATLGVPAWKGRTFVAEDERAGHEHVVLVSHDLWQRRGADPAVLGSALRLNGEPYTVVGVMPPGFRWGRAYGREAVGDVWAPFVLTPARLSEDSRGDEFLDLYARLRPGSTPAQARADLAASAAVLAGRFPDRYGADARWSLTAVPLQEAMVKPLRPTLLLLLGAVAVLLLAAASNVAGLLLARASGRRRETSVRAALGATRARLAREALAESAVLALLGGLAGSGLAAGLLSVLEALPAPALPRSGPLGVDARVMAFALAATLAAALVCGAMHAWQGSRADLMASLRATGPDGRSGGRSTRRALVVVQTALALSLLVGAGLLVRTLQRLGEVPAGFRSAGVLSGRVQLPRSRYPDRPSRTRALSLALERLGGTAGVTAAGAVSELPLSGAANSGTFEIEGQDGTPASRLPHAELWSATPGYFRVLAIPLLRGRLLDERDVDGAPPTVLISAALARRYFGDGDPLGRRIDFEGDAAGRRWRTIVGVVGDVRDRSLNREPEPQLYVPYAQRATAGVFLVAAGARRAEDALHALRAAVRGADPELALFAVATLDEVVAESTRDRRLARAALGAFAVAALLLAALGLYGVMAQSVRERAGELGVRLALGATRRHLVATVLSDALRLVAAGLVLGAAFALAGSRLLQGFVFGIAVADPATYAAAAVLVLAVAAAACAHPAWHAARADPLLALRAE